MNEHDDIMCLVRESFSGLRMDVSVERVFAASRARRRRRQLSGLTAVAATAGVAAAMTLTLGRSASDPALSGSPPPPSLSPGTARLAAFSVSGGPGESTTLVLYKGPQYPRLDPSALRQALARHGIPALVTVGTFCRSTPGASGLNQVVHALTLADGSDAMVIDGPAMPPGTRLSIGYFPGHARMLLIEDKAPLWCSSTSHQPAVRITPSGTPIGGNRVEHRISGDQGGWTK